MYYHEKLMHFYNNKKIFVKLGNGSLTEHTISYDQNVQILNNVRFY